MNAALTIGFAVSKEDAHAVTGYCAAEMAVEEANARGALPARIELRPIVDRRDRETARRAAERFCAAPDAVAVLGPLNSALAVATQDIYQEAGLLQLTSEASSPLLVEKAFPNFYRLVANDEYQGRALGQVAASYLGARRIAVLHDSSAWGAPIARIMGKEAARLGSRPVLTRGFGEAELALDFDDLIESVLAAQPDLVYFAIYWDRAHIIAHRLRDRGLKAVFLGTDALKPYAFLEVPRLDTAKPYHTLAGVDMRIKPSARRFMEAFARRHPVMLAAPQYAAEAYDCANLAIECIRRAAARTREAVCRVMPELQGYKGAIGKIEFDERGDLVDPEIGLYRCVDGQREFLGKVRDLIGNQT